METIRKTRLVHRKLKEENNCLPFCVYLFSLFRFNFVRWKRHCHGSDYYSVMSALKKKWFIAGWLLYRLRRYQRVTRTVGESSINEIIRDDLQEPRIFSGTLVRT